MQTVPLSFRLKTSTLQVSTFHDGESELRALTKTRPCLVNAVN